MGVDTEKYLRKPLYVDAVRITTQNFDEIVTWCQGEVLTNEVSGQGTTKQFIKVRVHNPKNTRQTQAFVGDWLLYTERGYKVYTNKAFHASFDLVIDTDEEQTSSEFPREEGDIVVIGPQCFVTKDGSVLNWRGVNYVLQGDPVEEINDDPLGPVDEPSPEKGVDPTAMIDETPIEIAQAQAAQENEQARDEYPETHTVGGTPREDINVGISEGKRVLSMQEQEELSGDEIQELIRAGEAILVQDLGEPQGVTSE